MKKLFRKLYMKTDLKLTVINGRNYLPVFGIGLILLLCSCSSSTETERDEKDIRYEVKPEKKIVNTDAAEREYIRSSKINSIEKVNFNLDSEGKPVGSEKQSTLKYNSKGFLTETIIYDDEGKIKYRFTYDYDKEGNRTKTSRYTNGTFTNYYTYEYNEYGNKSKAYRFSDDGEPEEYYIYEYDNDGNLTEEEWFSADGKEVYSIENDYDGDRKTRSYTYDENGNLIYEYLFRYDEKGNIIEEIKYDNSGMQTGIIQYIYKYY